MYKRILLAYDGSVEGGPPFGRGLSWHVSAAPRYSFYLSSSIPVHCCWLT